MTTTPADTAHCPDCSIRDGITRNQAYDAFFATGRDGQALRDRILVRRPVVRRFVAGRADPTAVATLSCGHTVLD